MSKEMTARRLRELLHYDPETGVFTWIAAPGNRRRTDLVGKVAGGVGARGYWMVGVDGGPRYAHRLAVLYMTGAWPKEDVDHIDGGRLNNRWANLRCVSRSVNMQNQKRANKSSTTGLLGVRRSTKVGFIASIKVDRKAHYIGWYPTPEEAHAAYLTVKRQLHEGNTL